MSTHKAKKRTDSQPETKRKVGAPAKIVRWGLYHAASEFKITANTLSTKLKAAGKIPGEDGMYSTMDICAAVFGDVDMERARKIREDADGSALDNQRRRKELCDFPLVLKYCAKMVGWLKQSILGSKLSDKDKADLIAELEDGFSTHRLTQQVAP